MYVVRNTLNIYTELFFLFCVFVLTFFIINLLFSIVIVKFQETQDNLRSNSNAFEERPTEEIYEIDRLRRLKIYQKQMNQQLQDEITKLSSYFGTDSFKCQQA